MQLEKTELDEEKGRVEWEWKRIKDRRTRVYERMDEKTKKLKEERSSNEWLKREVNVLRRKFDEREEEEHSRRRKERKMMRDKEKEQLEEEIKCRVRNRGN